MPDARALGACVVLVVFGAGCGQDTPREAQERTEKTPIEQTESENSAVSIASWVRGADAICERYSERLDIATRRAGHNTDYLLPFADALAVLLTVLDEQRRELDAVPLPETRAPAERYLASLDEVMEAMRDMQQAAAREDEQGMAPGLRRLRHSRIDQYARQLGLATCPGARGEVMG